MNGPTTVESRVRTCCRVGALLALLVALAVPQAAFGATVIASDDFDTPLNLNSYSQSPAPGAFASPGDGFEIYQIGVSGSIPFGLPDESVSGFPGDTLGVISEFKTDRWFGAIDLNNGNNPGGLGTAKWEFNISNTPNLTVLIDMAAMGDFEASPTTGDFYNFEYSFDDSTYFPLFTSSVDESRTGPWAGPGTGTVPYTMDNGTTVVYLDDPLLMNGVPLTNNLTTKSAQVAGTGATLWLRLSARGDGGSEVFAFDNIRISVPEPTSIALLGLGVVGLLVRRGRRRS